MAAHRGSTVVAFDEDCWRAREVHDLQAREVDGSLLDTYEVGSDAVPRSTGHIAETTRILIHPVVGF